MSQQALRQASVRAVTGSAESYEGDWHRLFDAASITSGDTFNGRLLRWLNLKLSASYTNLIEAQQALATSVGAFNWASLGTFDATSGATGGQLDFSDANAVGGTGLGLAVGVI